MITDKAEQAKDHSDTINLQMGNVQKKTIEQAAAIQNKSPTEFILDTAYNEATKLLLDRKLFLVDDDTFETFEQQLEATPNPQELKALRSLLKHTAPWD